jgi:hypothetical protein
VVLARDKRRLAGFLGLPSRHKVVIETHELDSALLREQGCEGAPMVRLETRVLAGADGLVANCGGTLDAWREAHGDALPELQLACHNATSASRHRDPHPDPDPVVRCLGSARSFKGAGFYLGAAPSLPLPLEWIGASDQEQARFDSPESGVRLLPAVPYRRVPDVLARSQVLLLPLEDNLFGRSLTSPLKLWDYLATCAPIVAPDLPSVREIAAMIAVPLHLHAPGDVAGLADAVTRAMAAPTRAPHLRTWDRRAAELEAVLQQAGAGP